VLSLWTNRWGGALVLVLSLALAAAAVRVVDLSPRVEGDFFFADDDPQMQASRRVGEEFPLGAQFVLRVEDRGSEPDAYRARIAALFDALVAVDGVDSGFSIATHDAQRSPLYRRLLLTSDVRATNIILSVDGTPPEVLLPRIEAVVAAQSSDELAMIVSGVPAIVEQIRRSLYRDLVVFSASAVVVFALITGLVFRDAAIVVGTVSTCLVSVGVTLLAVQAMDVGIGLLTANLVTIVFVLTLSHVVFLTGNWRRSEGVGDGRRVDRLAGTLRLTLEGSFWSMATTLLGFASLLVASARPLRELGLAGMVGALTAFVVSYAMYPAFLGGWVRTGPGGAPVPNDVGRPFNRWPVAVVGVVVLAAASGVPRLDTDPGLLTYFARGSALYEGLALIDADGGSSTLDIVVEDPEGEPISSRSVYPRLEVLQAALEADSAVGVVLSPTVLIDHARTIPLAGLLPVGPLLDIASSDRLGRVGLSFARPERDRARFSLRMRETGAEPRVEVLARLRHLVEDSGLRPVTVAGLYDLQAQLGRLISSSLMIGIGGLLLLFLGVAGIVGRTPGIAAGMWVCLAAIPAVILGTFGHAGIAIDIISSPAANIALSIGADSMIHLVVRRRRLRGMGRAAAWRAAVREVGPSVIGATAIVSAGFGIFALSAFPPTRRFGLAVIVGTLAAGVLALVVLPRLACLARGGTDSLSAAPTPSLRDEATS
jgi:predicted RND superfamily exporter protein